MKTNWTDGEYYNASDMNRVGEAVAALTQALENAGFVISTSPKTNWTSLDEPTESQLNTYLSNVSTLRGALSVDLPLPSTMSDLNATGANNIERVLEVLQQRLEAMQAVYLRSPQICGGVCYYLP